MSEPQTWQDLLARIIRDPEEKLRLADDLGIHPITLERWSKGESTPRPGNLQRLLNATPEKEQFIKLLDLEQGNLLRQNDTEQEIPAFFYEQVLRAIGSTPDLKLFWTICALILPQALQQLDPKRLGVDLSIVLCMPPDNGSIRSLRSSVGIGTDPWHLDFSERFGFLGAESLPGHAVSEHHQATIQSVDESGFLNVPQMAASQCASPITLRGHVAGCLLVSSVLSRFFGQERLKLITSYADLLILAFQREDFYPPTQIDLRPMPALETQPTQLSFRLRVAEIMKAAYHKEEPVSKRQAEEIARREQAHSLLLVSRTEFEMRSSLD